MPDIVRCDLCGRQTPQDASYIVKIEVYADPSIPPLSSGELETADFDQLAGELIAQMEGMTSDDLQDDVHRAFQYRLCRACQRVMLANPLGKPRRPRQGEN